jgi:hypothetical protein
MLRLLLLYKVIGGDGGDGVTGWWGEVFFLMKNSFLLIKILFYSPSPHLPRLPTNQILGGSGNSPALRGRVYVDF